MWVGLGEGTKSLVGFSGSTEEGRRGEGPFFGLLWLTRHIHEEEGGSNEAEIGSGGVRGGRVDGGGRAEGEQEIIWGKGGRGPRRVGRRR